MKTALPPLALLIGSLPALVLGGSALAQAPLYDLPGPAGSQYAYSLASVGDVDGDGFEDLAVGAPRAAGLQLDAGCVYVMSARTGHPLLTVLGEVTGDRFGWDVAGLGDIDGDGVGDLIVGAPLHEWTSGTDKGAVYTISGANGALIWKLGGNSSGDRMGTAVAGPGDVNGDGVPDYAFSLPYSDQIVTDGGLVWIHSGATHGSLRLYTGQQTGETFGFALDGTGDMNGDGVPDLLVGSPRYDPNAALLEAGRGVVVSGAGSGIVIFNRHGQTVGGQLGYSVAGLGDSDGDGFRDVAFGEPFFGSGAGKALVVSGGPNHAQVLQVFGADGERLGWSVAGLDDTDGDGLGDLIIGAPLADYGGIHDNGRVDVYKPSSGALLHQWSGYVPGDEMGSAVASAGDLNTDGFTDMVSGAPLNDDPGLDSGWARLILGSAPYPVPYCAGKLNSHGCTPPIIFTGCASASIGDNFHLHADNVLPNQPGILIWSLGSAATPFMGGTLCLAPPIRRTPPQVAIGAGPCGGQYDFHFSQALMAQHGLVPGSKVFAQYWYRDPGLPAPNSIGLTNGLAFDVLP